MASSLLPTTRLMVCPTCAEHVKTTEDRCPHCDAVLAGPRGVFAWAAGLALAGVMLASCNEGKDDSTIGSSAETIYGATFAPTTGTTGSTGSTSEQMTGEPTTGATTTTSEPTTSTTDATTSTTTTTATDATSTGDSSDTGSDTGTSSTGETDSTSLEPDYGVPQTTGTGTT